MEDAVRWWEQAAEQGHVYAHVELAKHFEHRKRNYVEAQKWAVAALVQIKSSDLPVYIREHWEAELEHRIARLDGKLQSRPSKRKKHV